MLRGYHCYSSWEVLKLETDDLQNDYTFGFELEVQQGESEVGCEEMSDILETEFDDLFIYERDGSIGVGFEIISQPMTWNWFKTNIVKFKKLFEILNNANYRSHIGNQCGLHIHIGKQGLGLSRREITILDENNHIAQHVQLEQLERVGDVVTNINIQLERFKTELFKFSRRKEMDCHWCRYLDASVVLENGFEVVDKRAVAANTKPQILRGGHDDRYKALNLNNSKTVELRLFRGTLKWTTFYFTMNLMNNLVCNAKQISNVVEWKDLIYRGLNNREKSLCKAYCIERQIDLDRNIVVSTSINKNKRKLIDKTTLLNAVMNDD